MLGIDTSVIIEKTPLKEDQIEIYIDYDWVSYLLQVGTNMLNKGFHDMFLYAKKIDYCHMLLF